MSAKKPGKVDATGFRLAVTRNWASRWYANNQSFATLLAEDLKVREFLKTKLKNAAVSRILIERPDKKTRITIYSARPGVVIGSGGGGIQALKAELTKRLGMPVVVDVEEVRKPEVHAQLIADSITQQLEMRIMFRRAMKRAMQNAMQQGAQGIKIMTTGRLNDTEIARTEWYREGRVPLHTLRADIDYGTSQARTSYGVIGIKVWVYRGDRLTDHEAVAIRKAEDQNKRSNRTGRPRSDRPGGGLPDAPDLGWLKHGPHVPQAEPSSPSSSGGGIPTYGTPAPPSGGNISDILPGRPQQRTRRHESDAADLGPPSLASPRLGEAAKRSSLVKTLRLRAASESARTAMFAMLPVWASHHQASNVSRLKMTIGGDIEPPRLLELLCSEVPAPMLLRSNMLGGRFDKEKQYAVIGRFVSGVVRTVGSVRVANDGAGQFVPFGFWSLIDPDDESLNTSLTRQIETTVDLLAVESF